MKALITRGSCIASLFLIAGCYWGRRRVDEPTPIPPGDPVWIWTSGRVEKWHWVVITQDSVSGVPWKSRRWLTCVRSIPRVQVDSMKHGYRTSAEEVGGITAFLLVWRAVCAVVAPRDREC